MKKDTKNLVSDTEKVNEFMLNIEHPLKTEMEEVRRIILDAHSEVIERIKWGAPSFHLKEDMVTFNHRAKNYVHLVFHNAAVVDDGNSGILEGDYKDRRMVYFHNMDEVNAKKEALKKVINDWYIFMSK